MDRLLSALAASLLLLAACAGLMEPATDFRRGPQSDLRTEMGVAPAAAQACRVYVVEKAPAGERRIGSIHVPESLGAAGRIDEESRTYACGLKANQAVKEEEFFTKQGKKMWRMGLYAVAR